MSTYRLFSNNENGEFVAFDLVGVFHREEDAHVAAEILTEKFGKTFEVVQSVRGRPKGSVDRQPRKHRTKQELIAKVLGIPEVTTDNDNEPPPPSTVDAPVVEPVVETSAIDSDNADGYNEPSPESFDSMMREIELERVTPDSQVTF